MDVNIGLTRRMLYIYGLSMSSCILFYYGCTVKKLIDESIRKILNMFADFLFSQVVFLHYVSQKILVSLKKNKKYAPLQVMRYFLPANHFQKMNFASLLLLYGIPLVRCYIDSSRVFPRAKTSSEKYYNKETGFGETEDGV